MPSKVWEAGKKEKRAKRMGQKKKEKKGGKGKPHKCPLSEFQVPDARRRRCRKKFGFVSACVYLLYQML